MSHTPGPWSYDLPLDWPGDFEAPWIVENGDMLAVCRLHRDREADARLIAAAPDLLEACESALYRLRDYNYSAMVPTIHRLVITIAKAKGE